ncbi:type IV pilus biogenesis protein PilM [Bremerella sp.]|uniref:type IV pilus biogenesis protein PilM n=1 Tax=Bremerella sp. TaxID=2795602 RepID=UPI003919EC0B
MAKKLAIEWDSRSLRMVVARQRGSSIVVDQALHFPLPTPPEGSEATSIESRVARLLTDQVAAHGLSKLPAIVGINRSAIELQVVTVPPVPDDELPDIVRYQAMRECSSLGEDGVVDFIKMPPAEDGKSRVHAAAISAKNLKSCQKICDTAQIQPQSFYVRSFGAAHLVASQSRLSGQTFLIVETLEDRVELTVVSQNEVILTRSTRLPGEPNTEHYIHALQGEIRRTMLAAQSKSISEEIGKIVILGPPMSPDTWHTLGTELKSTVEFLDPLSAEHVSGSLDVSPEIASQFGALIGMLLADGSSHHANIDFLNPRRKPDPPDRKRIFVLSGVAAALVVLMVTYLLYSGISSRDAEIVELKDKIANLQKSNKPLVAIEEEVIEIDNWVSADVQWLNELYRMSKNLPSADEMITTRVHMQPSNTEGGTTALEGFVSDQSVIRKIETSLMDEHHAVLGKGSQERVYGDNYTISFQEYVTITPDGTDRFAPREEDAETETAVGESDDSAEVSTDAPEEEAETPEPTTDTVNTTGDQS